MSFRVARLLNIVVPGAGLIILRREWLGFAVAMLFCLLAQIALLGWLLIPATVPVWVRLPAGLAALAVWGWAQWLTADRIRTTRNHDIDRELAALGERARKAFREQRVEEARDLLRAALAINDEHLPTNACWAELMTETGKPNEAIRAWRRVLLLARDPKLRDTAQQAIQQINST